MNMGVNHGEHGGGVARIWGGDANANFPPRFCHVSKFQAPDSLCYNAAYHSHNFDNVFTTSTSTKLPLQAENPIFFWQGHGQICHSVFSKTCHFKWKIRLFWRGV